MNASRSAARFVTVNMSLLAALLASCGGKVKQPSAGGSETNWLGACTKPADCPRGDCICGTCTLACSDSASCESGPPSSTCAVAGSSALAAMCGAGPLPAGACLPPCSVTCSAGATCVADHCVPRVPVDTPAPVPEASTVIDATRGSDVAPATCAGPIATHFPADVGTWHAGGPGGDTTGVQSPDPFVLTNAQACLSGHGFTTWGTLIQIVRNGPAGAICSYDVSGYTGVRFTVSGTITSGIARFVAPTPAMTLVQYGGTCTSTAVCGDNFGMNFTVTGVPTVVSVPFAGLSQEGWGQQRFTWDPHALLGFQWAVRTSPAGNPVSFSNVCVDNVELY